MWLKWLPWKFVIRKLARSHGFLDPIMIWSYFQNFAQPSEVAGPIELIRDSAIFHSRGLINCRAIPQNQDWIWPYWINQQFNPYNKTFIPRAFSLTYVNLTQRNWTAVGQPDCAYYPIVDAAGLVMPHWDGWSLDFMLLDGDGNLYAPSRQREKPDQKLIFEDGHLSVITEHTADGCALKETVSMKIENASPVCSIKLSTNSNKHCRLIVSLRPYNPEGISFVHQIEYDETARCWNVNNKDSVIFARRPDEHFLSEYKHGDVINNMLDGRTISDDKIKCKIGLATAAAVFDMQKESSGEIEVNVPLDTRKPHIKLPPPRPAKEAWQSGMGDCCRISIPDQRKQFLYDTAVRTVLMHSNEKEVYPGPFTYKKFWFRDASFILYAMLCANVPGRVKKVLDTYPHKQNLNGYFQSQHGEWDSNGQALWIMDQYRRFVNETPDEAWQKSVEKGADWIIRKCTSPDNGTDHAGLLPAGFSAEHFGPNDFYYWDDYWAVAGLRSAADILQLAGDSSAANRLTQEAGRLIESIEKSIKAVQQRLGVKGIPVSCNRRMDSAAIGSLVCRYPTQVYSRGDEKLLATAEHIFNKHCFNNGFLLDVSHSGINAYLTIHLAQVFMQAGDERFMPLEDELTRLATPTGQWPEAIHPQTEAGCMGDGQHVWAAAEWVTFMRNSLLYEDIGEKSLVLGAGIHTDWSRPGNNIKIGPAPTIWGKLNLSYTFSEQSCDIELDAQWHGSPENIAVRIPGFETAQVQPSAGFIKVHRRQQA